MEMEMATPAGARGLLARAEATLRRARSPGRQGGAADSGDEADDAEDAGAALSPSAVLGARKPPGSLTRLVNALRAPELEAHRELFEDLFELAVLDVRKFECAMLAESETLKRENADLRRERDEAQAQLRELADRQTRVGHREQRVRAQERRLAAEAKSIQAAETRLKRSSSRVLPPAPDDSGLLRASLFAYLRDCEGLVGKPQAAVQARVGLNESTHPQTVQAALTRHFREIEAAFAQLVRSYRDEIEAMSTKSEESARSNTAVAASRIRERKAQRERDKLVQAMQTIDNLARGMARNPSFQGSTEIDMIQRIAQGAQESPLI